MYRADHVGSLLRPKSLRLDPDNVSLQDQCILDVLRRQKDLGFKIFTDGEQRRRGFMTDFYDSVEGLDMDGAIARAWQGGSNNTGRLTGIVVEKIRQKKRLAKHEAEFLLQHASGDVKITLPSANQFPAIAYRKGLSERAYETHSAFLWGVAPIIKSEIEALVKEGVRYIQLDAPRYSYYVDPKWRRYIRDEMGLDPEEALDEAIRVDNACLREAKSGAERKRERDSAKPRARSVSDSAKPQARSVSDSAKPQARSVSATARNLKEAAQPQENAVTFAIHLCRGNNQSQWYAEGGYDPIAEKLFNELNVDVFLLEYESERAGAFEPLRFVPRSKAVVLGLISSKVPELESQEDLLRRIEAASRYLPLENLALSPQCGFASTIKGNLLTEEEQWRKLQLVVETARRVWGEP